jgi:branched-chain amino acid transport system substrate-binding protein
VAQPDAADRSAVMAPFMRKSLAQAALAVFVLASCGSVHAQTSVKVGFHGALTGPNSVEGLAGQIATQMVVEKWNKAGGINGHPIDLVIYDDQAKPDVAVPIANKLVGDDKVVAVLSSTISEPTKAAAPFVDEAKIPYISAWAASPDITKIGSYVFRLGPLGEVEGKAAAMALADVLKKKRVVMMTIKNDMGKQNSAGFHEMAKKLNIEILKEIEFSPQDRQYGPAIANIKSLNPDVVFMTGYYFNGTFVPQLRAAGVDIPFVGMSSFSAAQFLDIAGPSAEGALVTTAIDWSTPLPVVKSFLEEFQKRAGYAPTSASAHAYAAADLLFTAMAATRDFNPTDIRDKLAAMKFDTVIGPIKFNSLHEAVCVVYISEVKSGRFVTRAVLDDPALAPPDK